MRSSRHYAGSPTMPSEGTFEIASKRNYDSNINARLPIARHSFLVSQAVQEAQQLIPRSIAPEAALQWCRLRERLFLHGERRFEINLRGVQRLMPQPKGDHGPVHPRLKQ